MAKKPTRLKIKAAAVAQTRDDAAESIGLLGMLQRQLARETADMNDKIAAITAEHQPALDAINERIRNMQAEVQGYCEAHRDELTEGGRVKTANFITGEIQWRQRPPSVRITGAESVIEFLKRMALGRFVRTKEEVNKEAILNEPEAVRGVAGISIVTGVEDFVITPFEQQAEVA